MNVTDDYNDTLTTINTNNYNKTLSPNCTINENIIYIFIPTLLLTFPCGLSFLCFMSLMVYTLIKPLFSNKKTEMFLYSQISLCCIITGPIESGKSVFLTKLMVIIFNEYDKIYIYPPSLHQDLYQKIIKCFSKYIPIHIIPNILNEKKIDIVIDEIVKNEDFNKSDTEIEIYESIDEKKFPQDYEDGGINILDDFNQKEMNDPRVQATFKRSRHIIIHLYL